MSTTKNWQHLFTVADTIYKGYGTKAIKTEALLKNLLADLAPECTNETSVLLNALSNQAISHTISKGDLEDINYLVDKLRITMGLSQEWSENISICIFKLLGKQDISIDTTEQITKGTTPTPPPATPPAKKTQTPEQRLITSGYSFLRNGKWDKATDRFDQSLKTAKYPRAYIGKLMAQLHIGVESDLPFTNYDILNDPNWLNAMSIAKGSYKHRLERYAREHQDYINKKIKKLSRKKRRKSTLTESILLITGITLIFIAAVFGINVWFTDMSNYTFIEYIMTMFVCAAVGEGLVLLSNKNSNDPIKKRLISYFSVSIGLPVGVIITCIIIEFAIPIVNLLFS